MVPSRFVAGEVERSWSVGKDRIVVTPEAVDPETFHRPSEKEVGDALLRLGLERDRYVLCLGLVETRKNLTGAIAAWETYRRAGGIARLAIAGKDGRGAAEVRAKAAASPWSEEILFLGHVPQENLAGLIGGSLAGFYLSLYEGFGLPVLESFACGSTVLASSRSSVPEVWGAGSDRLPALIFQPDDADSAAASLLALQREPSRLGAYREQALRRAGEFDWKRCARLALDAWRSASEPRS